MIEIEYVEPVMMLGGDQVPTQPPPSEPPPPEPPKPED